MMMADVLRKVGAAATQAGGRILYQAQPAQAGGSLSHRVDVISTAKAEVSGTILS